MSCAATWMKELAGLFEYVLIAAIKPLYLQPGIIESLHPSSTAWTCS